MVGKEISRLVISGLLCEGMLLVVGVARHLRVGRGCTRLVVGVDGPEVVSLEGTVGACEKR